MIGVATGCQQSCLGYPVLALDTPGKGDVMAHPNRFLRRPIGDLAKMIDAQRIADFFVLRSDPLDKLEIVRMALRRRNALRPGAGMLGRDRRGRRHRCSGSGGAHGFGYLRGRGLACFFSGFCRSSQPRVFGSFCGGDLARVFGGFCGGGIACIFRGLRGSSQPRVFGSFCGGDLACIFGGLCGDGPTCILNGLCGNSQPRVFGSFCGGGIAHVLGALRCNRQTRIFNGVRRHERILRPRSAQPNSQQASDGVPEREQQQRFKDRGRRVRGAHAERRSRARP